MSSDLEATLIMNDLGRFFDEIACDYDAAIERCVPRYREMLEHLVAYVPEDLAPERICELGCGTGNLTRVAAARWPDAELTLVDMAAEMLAACRQGLGARKSLTLVEADFDELDFPDDSFDLVLSSISIHHLNHEQKGRLFAKTRRWLTAGGVLTFSDQMRGQSPTVQVRHINQWRIWSREAGADEAEWNRWMEHQVEHDHHETYQAHVELLREAGFEQVDCLWRNLLWTIVQAV